MRAKKEKARGGPTSAPLLPRAAGLCLSCAFDEGEGVTGHALEIIIIVIINNNS